jgi:formylglycine-generating enzyme required for sulfatase activity
VVFRPADLFDTNKALKESMKKKILRTIFYQAVAVAAVLTLTGPALAMPEDYDPVTGEPKCVNCHTPERSYSIDYTRDSTCVECHGAGLSDAYLSINDRFRVHDDPEGHAEAKRYAQFEMNRTRAGKRPEDARDRAPKEDGEMVLVPGGEFTMGSDNWWPKSQPEHKRTIKAFYIDKYEVTNRRYKKFVDATGHQAPRHWTEGRIPAGREDHPVVYLTWNDADAFCHWEGKRLPHEYEWEKAARGEDARTFPWGDKFSRYKANTPQLGNEDTMPVGSFDNGVSPYGAYDMAGNVWEWVGE